MIPRVALFLLVLPTTVQPQSKATIRDSAGVRIVENAARSTAPVAFRVDSVPTIRLGGLGRTSEFESGLAPSQLIRLIDGRYLTAERSRLRVWDASGRLQAVIGRDGSGPGEFRRVGEVCILPDGQIRVLDRLLSRVTLLSTTLQPRFTARVPIGDSGKGCYGDGGHLTIRRSAATSARSRERDFVVIRVGPLGDSLGVVGRFQGSPLQLFPLRLQLVLEQAGFVIGTGEVPELRRFDRNGDLTQVIRFNERIHRISNRERDAGHPSFFVAVQRSSAGARRGRESTIPNGRWPAYTSIQASADGLIWINNSPRDPRSEWYALSAGGELIGRLAPPPRFGVEQSGPRFSSGFVTYAWTDEDGAPHIGMYRLHRIR